jgi:hypothetical protein
VLTVLETAETRPESRILAAAGRQHGLVTTPQLLAAGWSKDVIAGRLRDGWLTRVQYGVYLAGPLATEHTLAMAAVLATGGVSSHYPAAVLWDLRPAREGPIDVTTPRKLRSRPGITVHRSALDPRDITRRHGIPTTSAARTILDLAATEPTAELERALNEAGLQRRVSPRSLDEQFSRYPHHRGTTALTKLLETEPHLTRSDAEIIARDLIRKAGLPQPRATSASRATKSTSSGETTVSSWRSTAGPFDSMRSSFEGDRRRDQRLTTAGWRVLRVTARQLVFEPELVVATLTRALALPR